MATLIAGILWFDKAPSLERSPLPLMVQAMGEWAKRAQAHTSERLQFAIASRSGLASGSGPNGQITCADLDMAWWAEGSPDAGKAVSPHALAAALSSEPELATKRLDGEYAYAHWDPTLQELLLGRDGVGARPLYYVHVPGHCAAFASLLPGLLAAKLALHEVNREVIAKLATGNFAHGDETQFTNIRRVMPGETVTLTEDGATRRSRWRLECRDPLPPSANRADVMAVLRDKIDRAVQRRMPTQGPVLSHLSGGLDSSAISALAARAAADSGLSVRAYAFGGRPLPQDIRIIDEQPAIDAVLAAYPNIDLHPVFSPDHELLARGAISPVFPMFDGPEDLYEQVVRDAAALGGTSILAGFGGDEVVSYAGTGGFAEMLMKGRWRALWSISRQVGRRSGRAAWRIIASEVQRFVLPKILPRLGRQGLGRSNESIRMLNRFLKPAFQTLTHDDNPELRADSGWLRAERIHIGHTVWIQEQAAQVAGRHGLRYASPLLDRDVLEFAIRLPPEFLHMDGLMRGGIRGPMDGILPDLTRMRRTKLHFDPAGSLVFARDVAAVHDCVRTLQASSAAEMFDLDLVTETLADVPDARDVVEQIRLASARGEQFFLPELGVAQPVLLARFVDTATRALKNT